MNLACWAADCTCTAVQPPVGAQSSPVRLPPRTAAMPSQRQLPQIRCIHQNPAMPSNLPPSLRAVIPLCIAYTFVTQHIDWSGIRYWRAGGKVVRVQH